MIDNKWFIPGNNLFGLRCPGLGDRTILPTGPLEPAQAAQFQAAHRKKYAMEIQEVTAGAFAGKCFLTIIPRGLKSADLWTLHIASKRAAAQACAAQADPAQQLSAAA